MSNTEKELGFKFCCCCGKQNPNYKCPHCRVNNYCSVKCCNEHKLLCNPERNQKCSETEVDANVLPNKSSADETDLLTTEQHEKLKNSKWLNNIIKSKRLRKHIIDIDRSPERASALKKALKNPEFENFIDKLLNEIRTK